MDTRTENGAVTGAFGYLFNECLEIGCLKNRSNGGLGPPVTQDEARLRAAVNAGFAILGGAAIGGWIGGVVDVLFGAPAAASLFVDGATIERSYAVGQTTIDVLGEVSVNGTNLTINNVAIYPAGQATANVGTSAMLRIFNSFAAEAQSEGFTSVTVNAVRYSGANPGRVVSFTRSLGGP